MADGVLPRRELLPVIGEAAADELTDPTEGELLLRALEDSHGDECDVGVRRLYQAVFGLLDAADRRCALLLTLSLPRLSLAGTFAEGAPSPGADLLLLHLDLILQVVVARFSAEVVKRVRAVTVAVHPLHAFLVSLTDHVDVHIFCREHSLAGHVAGSLAASREGHLTAHLHLLPQKSEVKTAAVNWSGGAHDGASVGLLRCPVEESDPSKNNRRKALKLTIRQSDQRESQSGSLSSAR